MKNKTILITVVVALIVGALAFYGGTQYQIRQRANFAGGRFDNQQGDHSNQFRQGSGLGLRPVSGEIISQDDKSITVKLTDGSSKIIILSDRTEINKTSEGSKEDLKTGERITTFGSENSDGSVTAQNISIGDTMFRGPQGEQSNTE